MLNTIQQTTKKDEITKDGVKYYLAAKELKDDSKPATGDVVEGTTTVTYVYEKSRTSSS